MIDAATAPLLGLAFALALAATAAAVPLARALAIRTSFYDRPVGFKRHAQPTPYLGGLAVLAGLTIACLVTLEDLGEYAPLLGCALALGFVGTVDDRVSLPIWPRVGAEVIAGIVLWEFDLGWAVFESGGANLVLTVLWVVGLVNAFNLMDNLDGAAGTVAATSAAGAGVVALALGDPGLAVVAFAVTGTCVGFLGWNLARPSRIFLGDGGSMPLGLLVAGIIMGLPAEGLGWAAVPAFAPLVGLVIFDTALVAFSRTRRGVTVTSGARDHLTHRLLARLDTPLLVAIALLAGQALLDLVSLGLAEASRFAILNAAVLFVAVAAALILALEGMLAMPVRAERSG